jgi:agmatinase
LKYTIIKFFKSEFSYFFMVELFCVPRVNALGLRGPEDSCEDILKGRDFVNVDVSNEDISDDEKNIYDLAKKYLGDRCFFVGGDHSITYPIGKAFLDISGRDDSLLVVFDAHADCMPAMMEPTHEEIIYGLVDYGWNPENIFLVGLRKIEVEEREFLKEKGISFFEYGVDLDEVWEEIEAKGKGKKVYVSVDVDVFDPKIAPGVSYVEDGGMDEDEFFDLFGKIRDELDVRAYDLVEVVKEKDVDGKTVDLARRIVESVS